MDWLNRIGGCITRPEDRDRPFQCFFWSEVAGFVGTAQLDTYLGGAEGDMGGADNARGKK